MCIRDSSLPPSSLSFPSLCYQSVVLRCRKSRVRWWTVAAQRMASDKADEASSCRAWQSLLSRSTEAQS
eukprot:731459-Rhodomonas_salina.1